MSKTIDVSANINKIISREELEQTVNIIIGFTSNNEPKTLEVQLYKIARIYNQNKRCCIIQFYDGSENIICNVTCNDLINNIQSCEVAKELLPKWFVLGGHEFYNFAFLSEFILSNRKIKEVNSEVDETIGELISYDVLATLLNKIGKSLYIDIRHDGKPFE